MGQAGKRPGQSKGARLGKHEGKPSPAPGRADGGRGRNRPIIVKGTPGALPFLGGATRPTSLLYMVDCPSLRCQRKPQTACSGGSCCLRHKSLEPRRMTHGTSHIFSPNGRQKVVPTAEETEAHSRQHQEAALRQLEPWPRRSLEANEGEKGLFP